MPKDVIEKIGTAYEENFSEELPAVSYLIDKKVLAENNKRKVEMALMKKVEILQDELEEAIKVSEDKNERDYDVFLRVKPEKVDQITSEFIDGRKCIIIPIDESEEVNVNGITDLM